MTPVVPKGKTRTQHILDLADETLGPALVLCENQNAFLASLDDDLRESKDWRESLES